MEVFNQSRLKRRAGSDVGVYIGRPSKWGNPFIIGRDGTREDVVRKFEEWLAGQPELVAAARRELKGKSLICWCAPLACHGDVLMRIANEESQDGQSAPQDRRVP